MLFDKRYSVNKFNSDITNCDLFFRQEIMGAENFRIADKLLIEIEEIDKQFKIDYEKRLKEEDLVKIKKKAREKLDDTTWSMLADAPLSNDGKKLYRDYRQYLRDIPDLWKRQQIKELKVMSFEDWRKDPPKYKIEKKVIL